MDTNEAQIKELTALKDAVTSLIEHYTEEHIGEIHAEFVRDNDGCAICGADLFQGMNTANLVGVSMGLGIALIMGRSLEHRDENSRLTLADINQNLGILFSHSLLNWKNEKDLEKTEDEIWSDVILEETLENE